MFDIAMLSAILDTTIPDDAALVQRFLCENSGSPMETWPGKPAKAMEMSIGPTVRNQVKWLSNQVL